MQAPTVSSHSRTATNLPPTFDILAATEVELLDLGHRFEDLEATCELGMGCVAGGI